ncbi:uncharacterized protein TNCV_559421 [Trichonephila clavipes]|nr:uncharacterized protein TNCV_559421 [Trichonephila clavipes]
MDCVNANVAVFSCMRDFSDGAHNFEPWSSDEDLMDQMPRKKSNLNNASTREARRKRIKRAHQLAEQIESRNLAQRISTAEGHAQESQEQCNERLQENIIRTRAAGERDIATVGAQEQ